MTGAPSYPYVGPADLLALVAPTLAGPPLRSRADFERWILLRTGMWVWASDQREVASSTSRRRARFP